MPYTRYMSEEEVFLSRDGGYKYTLKEKPDLESLTVLAKRDRSKKTAGYTALFIIGIFLIVVIIGILMVLGAVASLNTINNNNESKDECVYYNKEKNTLVFKTVDKGIWYEIDVNRIRGFVGVEDNEMFRVIFEISKDEQDSIALRLGYATEEEKKACANKLKLIKEGKLFE